MSLLITHEALAERRSVVAGPLRPLAASLAADLATLLDRELYFPTDKALLSREGGRCARDGTLLEFDPFSPHEHRCPRCGEVYRGELHDRFWIYWYQLWLAERAVHAAALHRLGIDPRFGPLAAAILDGYVERYANYPNVDNVLGPTRLFFSTYLEAIWLLQICIATDLFDPVDGVLTARVRDRIIEPSRAIIAEYDEGASNRQVWNDAALFAAARLTGDNDAAEQAVFGPSGIVSHLSGGLLPDGTWFEGENYHLFAHRGLWYGVTMAEQAGMRLPEQLTERFQRGFATPFVTALPDLTFPSRRDSQYAVSLRQWRIAEYCELGIARRPDPALITALHRMYGDDVPRRETGRATSSADAERNAPPSSLTRADMSWRGLLCALPSLPPLEVEPPRSALLDSQGVAVFRRNEGRTYIALDYGHSGGGHGHPDRLNLLLADGDARWLDDYGTGSYVDPSLHWYRSTLAHNAPLVDGKSQARANGTLLAYDERGAAGWIVAAAGGIAPPVNVTRTIVVTSQYLIDELTWDGPDAAVVDLPVHADVSLRDVVELTPATLDGGQGLEDGFAFLRETTRQDVARDTTVRGVASGHNAEPLNVWARSNQDTEWWRAISLGSPGGADQPFRLLRACSAVGRHRIVMAWSSDVVDVDFGGDDVNVTLADGTRQIHRRTGNQWHIELHAGNAKSSIDLGGYSERAAEIAQVAAEQGESLELVLRAGANAVVELGEGHYRRSEQAWPDAGGPTATVTIERAGASARLVIDVTTSELTFAAAGAVNPYDNETAEINGDSVQLYLRTARGLSGWLLVPDADSPTVRERLIEGWTTPHAIRAAWERTNAGYRITVDLESVPDAIDVIVNEMPRGRIRRRGQLVMSGARREFVYLRGDRHEAGRLIPVRIADD